MMSAARDLTFDIVRYTSAEDVVASYVSGTSVRSWRALEAANFEIDGSVVGVDGRAQHDAGGLREFVGEVQARRVWGFAVGLEVHLWIGESATRGDIAELLGHELAHVLRALSAPSVEGLSDDEWVKHYDNEEEIADGYGAIARTVVEFLVAESR